jgi:hypothetical protein
VIKALVLGLGLVLGAGVVSAQPAQPKKTATPKKKAPAAAPKAGDQPAATPATPDSPAQPAAPTPAPVAAPATPAPAAPPAVPSPATAAGSRAKPAPMKTDEKAGANEALQRNKAGYKNVSKTDEDCANRAFHQGNDMLNNGLFAPAVARYREALRCWDHPGIHYNLALALINLDQPIEVYEQLNEAIKYGADPLDEGKFEHAKEYLKLVAGLLADIEVSCDKPGAKIAVDGKEVFVAPGSYKAKVRVGKHTFYGDKEGYNARVNAPFIGPGETFRIELKLYTAEELTRYRRRWDKEWMPYTVIGAGALVGLIGGGMELLASSNYKDLNAAVAKCNTPTAGCKIEDNQNLVDMRKSGDTKRTLGYVGYGVAGATIATGALLAYLNRRTPYQVRPEDLEGEQDKGQDKPPAVSFTPVVSPGMTGALVQGHF